jgi:hypothetical protein
VSGAARLSFFTALAGALAGFGAAVVTSWFRLRAQGEELQVHLVDIAIGILRTYPKEDITPEDNARSAGCAM